ncbi:MAG: hypothetical protein WCJ24_00390 [Candidatus Saccharibacteria bacterium]
MKNKQQGFGVIGILLIVAAIGVIGVTCWYIYHKNNHKKTTVTATKTATPAKTITTPAPAAASTTIKPISDSLKENIAASIETQNTAALEGYMADTVTVVIAASGKGGTESAALAVKDLDYLSAGTSPWNFALPAVTLAVYQGGSYKQYFGDRTVVGKSANDLVVSFKVNDSGKIDTVFMAAKADLLK